MITKFKQIFAQEKLSLWLKPFNIIATSSNGGLVETITDAVSIDRLKKSDPSLYSLSAYYLQAFGGNRDSKPFKQAQKAFVRSMAGYSLLCYLLQLKDRHNGNILIDGEGHVVHVDFGFMLSNSPGAMNFEAGFKLTREFIEVMGGNRSPAFRTYKN